MTPEQKRIVKSIILECRKVLESDIEQVLINYGIYIDKPWVNMKYILNMNEEDENTRKRIEEVIHKLEKSGLATIESVEQYIKEIVYTYVNRLSALRVLEVRGLIEEVLIPRKQWGDKSYGHLRFYEVAREYCKYQSDIGLAYFIQLILDEVGEEIGMLFNTQDEYSLIYPSSEALFKVIDLLCNHMDEDVWKQYEIIGWIYQYFNEKEKDEVFDRLYKKKQKIKAVDIPAATQLFTPDWIVKWIVDNSLGTMWQEVKEGKREGKKLKEIRLLDPACGSGHFLVQAYDLFYKFYVEEGYDKGEIPYLILQDNLYGIDIDLRAIQLTAMVLFIKAKCSLKESGNDTNTKGKLSVNLVCADAVLLNGARLERLKYDSRKNPTILKMIDIIYEEFKDTRLKGSLIQPEKRLHPLFEEYIHIKAEEGYKKLKQKAKKKKNGQTELIEEFDADSLEEYKSKRNWSKEEEELLGFLDLIYKEAIRANDITQQMFATEAVKSVRLIDIFMKKYDVVVTNPPYMGNSGMQNALKDFISKNYSIAKEDLYSTFIVRAEEFLSPDGLLGMIVQHGFMFTSKYGDLRKKILDENQIIKVIHIGTGVFEEIKGEKVNSVMFILAKQKKAIKSHFIDMTNIQKFMGLSIDDIESGLNYLIDQDSFNNIKNCPFTYKLSDNLLNYFKISNFIDYAHVQRGVSTYDNDKYIKYYWEVEDRIRWKWINKVSGNARYLSEDNVVVDWSESAREFYISKNGLSGEQYYFKNGIFFPRSPYKANFSAKYLNEDTIIEDDKPGIFPINIEDIYFYLGLLNSNLFIFFLNILNPTNHYQVGDVTRLPLLDFYEEVKGIIKSLVIDNINYLKQYYSFFETARYFDFAEYRKNIKSSILETLESNIIKRDELLLSVAYNERKIDTIIYDSYKISSNEIEYINSENKIGYGDNTDFKELNELLIQESNVSNYDSISFKFNFKKEEVIKNRIKNKLYGKKAIREELSLMITYFISILFGRWQLDGLTPDDDGILPLDASIFEDDIVHRIYECISLTFGDDNLDNIIEEIEQILEKRLDEWLIKDFFKEHIKKYQRRPIYWHICSPKKTFNCFVYYHKLDHDSLYKVKGIYLGDMFRRYREDLDYYREQMLKARDAKDTSKENELKLRCNELELKLDDLNKLNKEIDKILPYIPDIDEGVLKNIIPLEPILSATVSNEKEREDNVDEEEEE